MTHALEAYFDGQIKMQEVERYTNNLVTRNMFFLELNRLSCRHPYCSDRHPCRAGKRRNGGLYVCTALTNTDFGYEDCPFFKTDDAYEADEQHERKAKGRRFISFKMK